MKASLQLESLVQRVFASISGRIEECLALALFGLMGALKLSLPVALASDTMPALSAHYSGA